MLCLSNILCVWHVESRLGYNNRIEFLNHKKKLLEVLCDDYFVDTITRRFYELCRYKTLAVFQGRKVYLIEVRHMLGIFSR